MKAHSHRRTRRLKAAGLALAGLIAGIVLLMLNRQILRHLPEPDVSAMTQPVDESTATQPASSTHDHPASPERAAATNMAGLLLMFSLLCFLTAAICLGWIAWDIRQARPAWKKQRKYPPHR